MNCASIMMVCFNRLELTKRTINNIIKTTDYPFRVIIIDNGSSDETPTFLRDLLLQNSDDSEFVKLNPNFKGFAVKFNKNNLGISVGRNQCLVLADEFKDEWLSTIDNDVELPEGWLTECINVLEKNPDYTMIGVNLEDVYYPIVIQNGTTFQNKIAGNLGTASTVFNRSLHEELGFFNNEYGPYGEEDADFGYRARVCGGQLGYIQTMGKHIGQGELDTGEYRTFKDNCRSNNLNKFRENCFHYRSGKKSCYISFDESVFNK